MILKKLTIFLILVFCLSLIGCNKDSEVNSFVAELDSVTNDIAQKANAGDIDGASAAFNSKKDSLKTKWSAVKDARGFQISDDSKKKLEESLKNDMSTLTMAFTTNMLKIGIDKTRTDKVQALLKEYSDIFTQ